MPTYTSRGGLIKPAGGEFARTGLDNFNANSDRVDAYGLGAFVCTSTSRPSGSNRWTGLTIFETDTKNTLLWNGTNWIYLSRDTGWTAVPGSMGGWTNSSFYRIINGILTIEVSHEAASNRASGTLTDVVAANTLFASGHSGDLRGILAHSTPSLGSLTFLSSRTFSGGNVNLYSVPTSPIGTTVQGTLSWPISLIAA